MHTKYPTDQINEKCEHNNKSNTELVVALCAPKKI